MKVIRRDSDGTLAYRDGMWTATLLQVLRAVFPDTTVNREAIRPYLQTGFPWQTPALPTPISGLSSSANRTLARTASLRTWRGLMLCWMPADGGSRLRTRAGVYACRLFGLEHVW
jgi:hypothetical protein